MTLGRTMSRHIGWQMAKWITLIFVIFILLMMVIDFTQLVRRIGFSLDLQTALAIAALRGPATAESVMPLVVLFAAMAAFFQMNRRLELTVTRAAGVSAWQVLIPASVVAMIAGVVVSTVYSPAAAALRELSVSIGGFAGGNAGVLNGGEVWLRQTGRDGPSIIGAERTAQQGTVLAGATAFVFDNGGIFRQRIDAELAELVDNEWVFERPTVTPTGQAPFVADEYRLHTNLSLVQIRQSLADPATISMWRLPDLIAVAEASSFPANALRLRWHELVSLPLLLAAMVLVAAMFSLRFSRTLRIGRLIAIGATTGFALYVVLVVSRNLAANGVVSAPIAAWTPAILALLISVSVLLREEDG
jgi:lipopolysaccharide export system permease protein